MVYTYTVHAVKKKMKSISKGKRVLDWFQSIVCPYLVHSRGVLGGYHSTVRSRVYGVVMVRL